MSSKKYYINNDVEVEELAAKLSKTIILDRDDENNIKKAETATPSLSPPRICDVRSFDDQIGKICQSLFHTLTSKQLEATYQRCLAIDLQHAGIKVLAQEREIKLQYKGRDVGTRRADIVLQTPLDKQWVVLELKALQNLTSEHMKQLEFYMYHFEIDIGYLINFPTDRGFPDLPSNAATYRQTILSGGDIMLSDRNLRGRHTNAQVQIIKVERVITKEQSQSAQIVTDATLVLSSAQPTIVCPVGRTTSGTFVVPIAKKTGEPCKLCTRYQSYCRYHKLIKY
eukprot:scaffold7188_cov116-Skeletonema_marinoi.AAC.9